MSEIEFSVMVATPEAASRLRSHLDAFEAQHHVTVSLAPMLWSEGWSSIANMAIYGHGPDVAEIGTTWISSVAAMNALRPFSAQEVHALGGPDAFLASSWRTGIPIGDDQVWAIPWLAHPEMLYYRRDWLERAGIHDAGAAFADPIALEQTLQRLRASGIPHPLGLTTHRLGNIIHEAATWIWNAGGDFLSADGKQVLFDQPAAQRGLRAYFSLRQYVVPTSTPPRTSASQFVQGDAAVAVENPWIALHRSEITFGEYVGVASMPGIPFLGGTSLVIWKHSRRAAAALELVRFLSQRLYQPGNLHADLFPARRASLAALVEQDAFYHAALASLQKGRAFPSVRLWGAIESRLIDALVAIWAEGLSQPDSDIDEIVQGRLEPVARWTRLALGE